MSQNKDFSLDRMWLLVLKDLSLNPENVLRRARLPDDLFHRENTRLSAPDYFRLWDSLEHELPNEVLPLTVGQLLSPEMFHPVIFAAFCSPNLQVAIGRIAEYKRLFAPIVVSMEEQDDGLFVQFQMEDPTIKLPASLALTELVYCTQVARLGTRERIQPLRVECLYTIESLSAYRDFFGVTPIQSDRHGLLFSPSDAQMPFMTASESLWETFAPDLRRKLSQLHATASVKERVKTILLEILPSGETSIAAVASRLALSPRTLQRRLTAEDTSFKDIVNQTRKQLALHYVTRTELSYPEIAFLIGFEETSSFFRAFREWTGRTPEVVRMSGRSVI